ncbi:MAG: serine/threonine protein kinase [Labilithrix sp.]|nr:serine/threonine protein kinase [Labilithrix sp.]
MEAAAEAPERVGRYEILLPIAKGGMATVYLARAEGAAGFDRYVAVKVTLPRLRSEPELRAHLVDEAKLVAHLRHTNVVPVLDVGEDALGVFLVMEYVDGDSLSGLSATAKENGAPLPARVGLKALVDALAGLHAAHEHLDEDGHPLHLVHRDFSPQNILVGVDGVARLTDFGIAKAASRVSVTAAGLIKGKMSYVAPEQARGATLDRRCDLWAAGVIAWEIVCGRKLVPPSDPRALLEAVRTEPPRIRTIVPDLPAALEDAIASVLKLDPDHRTANAMTFARELAAAARGAGMLADTDEVAEHVKRLAGPVLAERKARVADARRARLAPTQDGVRTAIGLPPFSPDARPAAPPTPAPGELSIPIEEMSLSEIEVPPSSPSLEPTREPPRSPPPVGDDEVRDLDPRRLAIFGGAVVLAIVMLAVVVRAGSSRATEEATPARSTAALVAPPASTSPPVPASAPAPAPNDAPDREPDFGTGAYLELTADAPIVEVRIGDRVVDLGVAAPKVAIELEPEEASGDLRIVAKATDGRTVRASLSHDERATTLTFGGARSRR